VPRSERRVSEGSTISVNYFSGSADRIQQMSLSKMALKPGMRALIIDDFMRGGGSIKGIEDMLREFDAVTAGIGVIVVAGGRDNKKIGDYTPLLLMNEEDKYRIRMDINPDVIA
jgi:purine operon repressor